jgi:hypothetical protein
MGLYAARRGSGGGPGGWAPAPAQSSAPDRALAALNLTDEKLNLTAPEEDNRTGAWGWIKNAIGDVGEIATGLLDLGGQVGSDILTAMPGGDAGNYHTDDLVKGLVFDWEADDVPLIERVSPGLRKYARQQYGIDPLRADLWPDAGKVATALYEDPLNTALDVFGTGAVAGGVARKGAKASAIRSLERGVAPADLPGLTKRILPGLNPESKYFDKPIIGQGVDRKLGTSPLDEYQRQHVRMGGYRPTLELGATPRLAAEVWSKAHGLHENPFRRGVSNAFFRMVTRNVDRLGDDVIRIANELEKGRSPRELLDDLEYDRGYQRAAANTILQQGETFLAAKRNDVLRVWHHGMGQRLIARTARQFLGSEQANVFAAGDDDARKVGEVLTRFATRLKKQGMGHEEIAHLIERVSADFEGLTDLGVTVNKLDLDTARQWAHDPANVARFDKAGLRNEILGLQKAFDDLGNIRKDLDHDFAAWQAGKLELGPDEVKSIRTERFAVERYARHLSEVVHWFEKEFRGEVWTPEELKGRLIAEMRVARHDGVMQAAHYEKGGWVDNSVRTPRVSFQRELATAYGPRFLEPTPGTVRIAPGKTAQRTRTGGLEKAAMDARNLDALFDNDPSYWGRLDMEFDNRPAPIYYPHSDPEKVSGSTLAGGVGKRRQGAGRMNQGPFNPRTWYNFLEGTYEKKNPLQAYAWGAKRQRSIIGTFQFIDKFSKRFGRIIRTADEATEFEVIYNPWLVKQYYKNQAALDAYIQSAMEKGLSFEDALVDASRQAEEAAKFLPDYNPLEHGKEMYAIPKSVANQLDAYQNWKLGPNNFTLFMGKSTDLWRSLVLAYSPRWLVNNLFGNIVFSKLMGVPLTKVATMALSGKAARGTPLGKVLQQLGVDGARAKALDDILRNADPDLARAIDAGFHSTSNIRVRHMGGQEGTLLGQLMGTLEDKGRYSPAARKADIRLNKERARPDRRIPGIKQTITAWNTEMENVFRRTAFMHEYERMLAINRTKKLGSSWIQSLRSIQEIAENGLDEATAKEAIRRTNAYFNDYRQLSPLERNLIRPYVAPFWGFWKHINLLTLKFPFEGPERAMVIRQMAEYARTEHQEQLDPMTPEYRQHGVFDNPLGILGDDISFRGAIPFSAVADLTNNWGQAMQGLLGPVPGAAQELMTGEDFLGRPFQQKGVIQPYGSDESFAFTRDGDGNITGVKPITTRQNPLQMFLSQIPQAYPILGAITGQDRYKRETGVGQEVAKLFGATTYPEVTEDAKGFQLQALRSAVSALYKDMLENQ